MPINSSINNSSRSSTGSASSSRAGSRAGTPTAMEGILNGASYVVLNPAALVGTEQTNESWTINAIRPLDPNVQSSSNGQSSLKCDSEDFIDVEAPTPTEKVP